MRKKLCLFLAIVLLISLPGCGSNKPVEATAPATIPTDSAGNMMNISRDGTTTYANNLPCPCDYNGSKIYLTDVNFYELYADNYTYTLFVIIKFDVSELSESDLHWLREEDLNVSSSYRENDNSLEFEHLSYCGSVLFTDTKELIYVFDSVLDESRYSFAGKNIAVTCNVTQEEEYESNNGNNIHLVNCIFYDVNTPDVIDSVDKIDKTLFSYILKWLGEAAGFYSKLG